MAARQALQTDVAELVIGHFPQPLFVTMTTEHLVQSCHHPSRLDEELLEQPRRTAGRLLTGRPPRGWSQPVHGGSRILAALGIVKHRFVLG
jgi:hypothetical protein